MHPKNNLSASDPMGFMQGNAMDSWKQSQQAYQNAFANAQLGIMKLGTPYGTGSNLSAFAELLSKREQRDLPESTIVAPLVGWRKWKATLFADRLQSINGEVWTPKKRFEAQCKASLCSGINCGCGVHAFKEQAQADAEYHLDKLSSVSGEVYLWGRILECEKGFRAQFAYPKAFVRTGLAEKYAELYGVPLIG